MALLPATCLDSLQAHDALKSGVSQGLWQGAGQDHLGKQREVAHSGSVVFVGGVLHVHLPLLYELSNTTPAASDILCMVPQATVYAPSTRA